MDKIFDTIFFVSFMSTLVILIFILMIFFTLREYKIKQLRFQRGLELLQLQHEKALLSAQLEIQEETLNRVAREIHDNISLTLTLAKLHLNTFGMQGHEKDLGLLDSGIDLIGRTLIDLNHLSKSLDGQTIGRFGLVHALETESDLVRKSGRMEVGLSINGKPMKLEGDRELHVFRIIQECFNNTLKHSGAKRMDVELEYGDDHLRMTVSDDGQGFDTEEGRREKPGSGLRNMENRATLLGGSLTLESKRGGGTKMKLKIPYTQSDANQPQNQSGPGG